MSCYLCMSERTHELPSLYMPERTHELPSLPERGIEQGSDHTQNFIILCSTLSKKSCSFYNLKILI